MKEITSVHNAAVQLLRELQKPRARRENGLFVCESAKLVGEAVALWLVQALFIEKGREAEYAPMIEQAEGVGCELYIVSTAVMQAVSTAKTPQGVVCTARIPQPPKALAGRRLVALPSRRHFLHAAWRRFRHPVTGAELDLRAPLPDDLRASLAALAHAPELADHPDPLATFGFYDDAPP